MKAFIGFQEALSLTLSHIPTLGTETVPLNLLTGRILSRDVFSKVDSPSVDVSLKDGFAVFSQDFEGLELENDRPIRLRLHGRSAAGDEEAGIVSPGETLRVTTGAPLPEGADAVLSEEFSEPAGKSVFCLKGVRPGQNVLAKGTDIRMDELAARKGEQLLPAGIGLLASAGLAEAEVFRVPRVVVIGTGDEVVAPGLPLPRGKLYASNGIEICSWLSLFNIPSRLELVGDRKEAMKTTLRNHLAHADAFITSGGVWGSERDLMIRVLTEMGWEGLYHRVRIGPGKAVAYGLLEGRPIFCLPGGPPSNEIAFLQLALPGILAMQGRTHLPFPQIPARLEEGVRGEKSWTQFIHARVTKKEDVISVRPERLKSRLQSMAWKDALIMIPEGKEELGESETVIIQLLVPLIYPHNVFLHPSVRVQAVT
jgi:molybdopterin molybdotransferase